MKRKIMTVVMCILVASVFAEAPEMQKYLPTEWKYMEWYDGELKQQIIDKARKETRKENYLYPQTSFYYAAVNEYGGLEGYYSVKDFENGKLDPSMAQLHPASDSCTVYEEKLLEHTFYYYIEIEDDRYPVNIMLACQNGDELVFYAPVCYNYQEPSNIRDGAYDTVYETYLIPGKKNKIKAVCISSNSVFDGHGIYSWLRYWLLDKRPVGHMGEVIEGSDYMDIYSSGFLMDKKNPFKYALLNAFDGDPSTSYVDRGREMYIEVSSWFMYFPGGLSEFKIINGYAKNEDLYKKNNRPKTIKTGSCGRNYDEFEHLCTETDAECRLADGTLDWQKFKFHIDQYFIVKDIYKGTHYNDTCIAELDFKYDGYKIPEEDKEKDMEWFPDIEPIGWLFSSEPE